MNDGITRALRACVVAVRCTTPDGPQSGTAFHVAEQLLLTCHHVVAGDRPVELRVAGQWQPAERVGLNLPLAADVALLRSTHRSQSCVRLGRLVALRDAVRTTGFPVRDGAPHEEQILGWIEDLALEHSTEPWKSGVRLLKFTQAQVWPGFSGAPLYDERTRRVVGIVKATRNQYSDLGGIAVPAAVVLDASRDAAAPAAGHLAELRKAQRGTWDDAIWRDPPGKEQPFLEHYLATTSPFFGRERALEALDAWLASPAQRALLVAEAGRGKSSLLAHWYRRLRDGDAAFDGRLRAALLPISIRFGHAREDEVLASLHRHIVDWHPDLRADDPTLRRERIAEGLARDAPPGVQHVLLIDGLDETVGWQFDAALLPRRLGRGVHLLAAARRTGDGDLHSWRRRLGWSTTESAEFDLGALGESDSIDAVAAWWGLKPDLAAALGRRLHQLSRGEPLVFGLYLASFGRDTPPAVEALAELPSGLDGVFERWWTEQAKQWQRDPAAALGVVGRRLLNLLALAFEPLSRSALQAVLGRLTPCDGDELDAALAALARFLVRSAEGIALCHPELARWRVSKLSPAEVQGCDQAYADWLRTLLAAGADTKVDAYALRHGSKHLQRSGTASLQDWYRVAGPAWRARHHGGRGWPQDYVADLARAAKAAPGFDAVAAADAASHAGGTVKPHHPGLPLRIAVAFGRVAIERLIRRVPARLAAQALQLGYWDSARTLRQVLAQHRGDFPRIAALGDVAAGLAPAELEQAMAALGLEAGGGFDWDDTLGAWQLAAAAARSGAFDDATLERWAASLQGFGATVALLSLAATRTGEARSRWLAGALATLPAAASHARDSSCLALGIRTAECITRDELGACTRRPVDAWRLGELLGFQWELSNGETAGAALRVAWHWLEPGERGRCAEALVGQLPHWIAALQSKDCLPSSDARWSIVHRNWQPRLGAIWDVCSVDVARSVYRQLRQHFASDTVIRHTNGRTCFAVMLRFASRLPLEDRQFEEPATAVRQWVFARLSTSLPETDDLFDAAASIPEWADAMAAALPSLRVHHRTDAAGVLSVIAPHLSRDALELQWAWLTRFDTDWRDRARQAILGAMAAHGDAAVRLALRRADEAETGPEQSLLDAVIAGHQGVLKVQRRSGARTALALMPAAHGLQAQLLSAIAAPLAPWSLDELELWVPKDHAWRTLAIGWLLPHVHAGELCDAETPWRLAIRRAVPDTDAPAEAALRIVFAEAGLDATLAWAAAMDEACDEKHPYFDREMDRDWTALAVCALVVVAPDQRDVLLRVALALPSAEARAEACAALCTAAATDPRAWAAVEAALRAAAATGREATIARILRRLRGDALHRGIEAAEINTRLLVRGGSDAAWADRAGALLRWADAALIDAEFMPAGQLVQVKSSTDRNLLRGGLAPRLLELGRVDAALAMAGGVSEPRAWLVHVAMLEHLHDVGTARRFVQAMMASTCSDLSLFAVARELQRGACDERPEVLHAICVAVVDAADSDARLRLHLAVLMPLLARLCGSEGVAAIAACARGELP